MKIAVLGDIHSNHIALEACMERIAREHADGIAFLGDYVSDCPYPQKTMRILRNIPDSYMTWFIRGNREDYMLKHMHSLTDGWHFCSQSGSLLYTFENLTGSDLRFFEGMPIGMEVKIERCVPFSICHGSMQSNSRLFYGDSPDTREVIDEMNTRLLVCGHCHRVYELTVGDKTIVNAGSVGNPQHEGLDATMVLLTAEEGEDWSYEVVHVPFDTEAVVAEFKSSGLLDKANVWSRAYIAALRTGRNYNIEVVRYVAKESRRRKLDFDNEALWQEAAEKLGI